MGRKVRQYIGGRYIPAFYTNSVDGSTQWEPNVVYDPLIYVTLQNGHMYISKKMVPATIGSPADNIEYWLDVGNYSGIVQELQEEIDEINAKLPKEKNLLVIGNSFVERGCTGTFEELFAHTYTYTASGVGFVDYTSHSTNFEDLLDLAINSGDFNEDDITDIIFVSAMGDTRAYQEGGSAYRANLATTLTSMASKIASRFENCDRVLVTLAETRNVAYFDDNPYDILFKVHRCFNDVMYQYGFEYIGWSGWNILFGGSTYIDSDNYHPTAAGAELISKFIRNAYNGILNYKMFTSSQNVSFYFSASPLNLPVNVWMQPDEIKFSIGSVTIPAGSYGHSALSTFIDLTELTVPIPAPLEVYTLIGMIRNDSTAVTVDNFKIRLTNDGHGRANIIALANYSGTLASDVPATLAELKNFSYTM